MSFLRSLIARCCAICALTLIAGSASAQGVADLRASRDSELQAAMERVVADAGLSGEVAGGLLALALVDATDPAAPRLAMLNGDRMMYAASMPRWRSCSAP
jgi:beta-lactamase class A